LLICFTHIPKTGGTTFRYILINNFSWRHIDVPESRKYITYSDFVIFGKSHFRAIESISGHSLHYSEELIKNMPELKLVVFIRDPISRIISNYHGWCRNNKPVPFKHWVTHDYERLMFHNYQTRCICGSSDFARAKDILQKKYFFAGSQDMYDYSLLLFRKMIGNAFDIRYKKKRVSKESKNVIIGDPENKKVIERLRRDNNADIELNNFVKNELFGLWSRKYGEITKGDLSKFETENQNYTFGNSRTMAFKIMKYFYYQYILR
jgi:hypothetical protein